MASSLQERNILDDIADPSFHTLKLAVETQEDFWRAFNDEHQGINQYEEEEDSDDLTDLGSGNPNFALIFSLLETIDSSRRKS